MKIIKYLYAVLLILLAGSCEEKFLDSKTNDPNNPTEVTENLQLTGILSNFSYNIIANDPARFPSYWIQYLTFTGVPPSEDNYRVNESEVNNLWTYFMYPQILNNSKILNEKATKNQNYHYAGLAKIMTAWGIGITTDLFGDVPFSEALNDAILKPKYDKQEDIYKAIQTLLDQAIADLENTSLKSPSADDLIYPAATANAWKASSLPRWKKLAYTLKARFHMHLTNAPGYDPATQSNLALQAIEKGFSSNADDALFAYYDKLGAENPWYQWTIDGKWNDDSRMAKSYVDRLKALSDPRLPIQAQPAEIDGEFKGAPSGVGDQTNDSISAIGKFYSDADAPVQWITYAEALFIKAEATFRTQGAAAAESIYKAAIAASMDALGVDATAKQTYINARPALDGVNGLKEIMTQKYIALFLQHESYNDWRRTGYPDDLQLAEGAVVNVIPLRFPYPEGELLNNAENAAATGVPIGYNALKVPVWWDSKP